MSDPISELSGAYHAATVDEEAAWEAYRDVPQTERKNRDDAWAVYRAAADRADQAFRALREAHVRAAAA